RYRVSEDEAESNTTAARQQPDTGRATVARPSAIRRARPCQASSRSGEADRRPEWRIAPSSSPSPREDREHTDDEEYPRTGVPKSCDKALKNMKICIDFCAESFKFD